MRKSLALAILLVMLALVGCRQTEPETTLEDVVVNVEIVEAAPTIGENILQVTVSTQDGEPIEDATVSIVGDMTHAGMVPVNSEAVTENTEGVYSVPIELTMGGDWIFDVQVTLASGESTSVSYNVDGIASEMMDMDSMDMSTAVSGAYMSITNTSDDDLTLVSVSAEAIGMIQIHETTVDENDISRMQQVEGGLVIAAGETVTLQPGGIHLMLMNLEIDLIEGETVTLILSFDDESTVEIDLPIANMSPEDDATIETDTLTITGFWARPTAVESMDMDDMEMESEATESSE